MTKAVDIGGIGMTSERTRARLIERLQSHGITNPRVLDVMLRVPRHLFIDEALSHRAYEDTALPIGFNQTISQPYIVARVVQSLMATHNPPAQVLEVGSGSGYQAAVLSHLVNELHCVERVRALYDKSRRILRQLAITNVHVHYADGMLGWPKAAPYDGIVVSAARAQVPQALLQQLVDGGRLIMPVGHEQEVQELQMITRQGDQFTTLSLEQVRFVPLLEGVVK